MSTQAYFLQSINSAVSELVHLARPTGAGLLIDFGDRNAYRYIDIEGYESMDVVRGKDAVGSRSPVSVTDMCLDLTIKPSSTSTIAIKGSNLRNDIYVFVMCANSDSESINVSVRFPQTNLGPSFSSSPFRFVPSSSGWSCFCYPITVPTALDLNIYVDISNTDSSSSHRIIIGGIALVPIKSWISQDLLVLGKTPNAKLVASVPADGLVIPIALPTDIELASCSMTLSLSKADGGLFSGKLTYLKSGQVIADTGGTSSILSYNGPIHLSAAPLWYYREPAMGLKLSCSPEGDYVFQDLELKVEYMGRAPRRSRRVEVDKIINGFETVITASKHFRIDSLLCWLEVLKTATIRLHEAIGETELIAQSVQGITYQSFIARNITSITISSTEPVRVRMACLVIEALGAY